MGLFDSPLIHPLHRAEAKFLQVLLTSFSLIRQGPGTLLRVHFDDDTPAIWDSQAKHHLRAQMSHATRDAYQKKLDDFLILGQGEEYGFNDPAFAFRYASGGTLPIVEMNGVEYFCFFYRDIHPIGWNIANGACDTRDELLNPFLAVDRELREELLIADFVKEQRYVFAADIGKSPDRPVFRLARAFWKRKHPSKDVSTLDQHAIVPKWFDGPDSLRVELGNDPPSRVNGCYVNINAEDFGIEIDRVAKIAVSDTAVFCDGEVDGDQLVNSPVGLFEVERVWEQLGRESSFIPTCFYFDTLRVGEPRTDRYDTGHRDGRDVEARLRKIIDGDFVKGLQTIRSREELEKFGDEKNKFTLCPVTERIVERYCQSIGMVRSRRGSVSVAKNRHVFISYCHENEEEVGRLREDLINAGERVWWDKDILKGEDWKLAIHGAMADSYAVIVCFSAETDARVTSGMFEEIREAIAMLREHKPGSIFLIPVRLADCAIPTFEIDAVRTITRLQRADLFAPDRRAPELELLIKSLRAAPRHP